SAPNTTKQTPSRASAERIWARSWGRAKRARLEPSIPRQHSRCRGAARYGPDAGQGSELGLTRMTACGGRDSLGCDLIRSSVMDVALERPRLRRLLDHFAEVADPREPWRVAHPLRRCCCWWSAARSPRATT